MRVLIVYRSSGVATARELLRPVLIVRDHVHEPVVGTGPRAFSSQPVSPQLGEGAEQPKRAPGTEARSPVSESASLCSPCSACARGQRTSGAGRISTSIASPSAMRTRWAFGSSPVKNSASCHAP